jgi:hypothetical protein
MDLTEVGRDYVDWIHLPQDRGNGKFCEHSDVPSCSIKDMEFLD